MISQWKYLNLARVMQDTILPARTSWERRQQQRQRQPQRHEAVPRCIETPRQTTGVIFRNTDGLQRDPQPLPDNLGRAGPGAWPGTEHAIEGEPCICVSPYPCARWLSYLSVAVPMLIVALPATGQTRLALMGHEPHRWISDLAFSTNGELLVSGSDDGTARVWSVESGALLASLDCQGAVRHVAILPDGQAVVTSSRSNGDGLPAAVTIWTAESWQGRQLQDLTSGPAKEVYAIALRPDGQQLVTATRSQDSRATTVVKLWDLGTCQEAGTLAKSHQILDLAFSQDGSTLAAVGTAGVRGRRGIVLLWQLPTLEPIRTLTSEGRNYSVEFSPQGEFLAVGNRLEAARAAARHPGCQVILWNLDRSRVAGRLTGFVGHISSMSFSPDNRLLAASATVPGGWGREPGELIQVWHLGSDTRRVLERDSHAHSIQFSPTGKMLATAHSTPRPGAPTVGHGDGRTTRGAATRRAS